SRRTPLHKQLYDGFRAAILERRLLPGQQVPSSRALANESRISRTPILSAYAQLTAEGYFASHRGSGTYVSSPLPEQFPASTHIKGDKAQKTYSGRRQLSRRAATLSRFEPPPWVF